MLVVLIVLLIVAAFIVYQAIIRAYRKRHPVPAPPILGRVLDTRFRRLFQPPDKFIVRSGIKAGMSVLEIGCGSGAFTTFTARAVGSQGRVYGLDIQPGMLKQVKHKLTRPENLDITNIGLVLASAYGLPFESASLDLVYMVTVLPEIPDQGRALREVSRVLKPGGTLAVTELLPDPDYPWRSTTIKTCQREGFVLEASQGNLWNYTVRFRKPSQEAPVVGKI